MFLVVLSMKSGRYLLDLNECDRVYIAVHIDRLMGILTLHIAKVGWTLIEKHPNNLMFKPGIEVDELEILGSREQTIHLILSLVNTLMDDEEGWKYFIEAVKEKYNKTQDKKWLEIIASYKPHRLFESDSVV